MKKKLIAGIASLGLLAGVASADAMCYTNEPYKKLNKDGYNIEVSTVSCTGGYEFYSVEMWNEDIKGDPNKTYAGEEYFEYKYDDVTHTVWPDVKVGWKKSKVVCGSPYMCMGRIDDITSAEVPGYEKGLGFMKNSEITVDFDPGEEYAEAEFGSEEDALKWADNMRDIFKKGGFTP